MIYFMHNRTTLTTCLGILVSYEREKFFLARAMLQYNNAIIIFHYYESNLLPI